MGHRAEDTSAVSITAAKVVKHSKMTTNMNLRELKAEVKGVHNGWVGAEHKEHVNANTNVVYTHSPRQNPRRTIGKNCTYVWDTETEEERVLGFGVGAFCPRGTQSVPLLWTHGHEHAP